MVALEKRLDQRGTTDHKNLAQKKKNIDVLDGVRAIACLSVIEYHVHYWIARSFNLSAVTGQLGFAIIMSGWSGVTLFFVLSGFLLFIPYAKSLLFENQWPAARTFYWRRILRIVPGYYISLALLIVFTHPEYLRLDHLKSLGLFLTFLMDAPSTYQQINGPFWTLAVEWQYYLVLPLLCLGFSFLVRWGKSPRQRLFLVLGCLLGMALWGVGTRYFGRYYTQHPSETVLVARPVLNSILVVIYGTAGKYYEDFAIGMIVCTLYIFTRDAAKDHKLSYSLRLSSIPLLLVGLLLPFFVSTWSVYAPQLMLDQYLGAHNWLNEIGYSLGFGLCLVALLFGPALLRRPFEWKPLRWIGTISYSAYIWHLPILLFVVVQIVPLLPHRFALTYLLYWACIFLVVIPFSYLFYRFVEYPGIVLARRKRS